MAFRRVYVYVLATKQDDVIKWKHFPRYWSFVRGIHKGQWRGALMFSLICTQINGWVNTREAGDLRRHRGNYDVIVMTSRYDRHCFHCQMFSEANCRETINRALFMHRNVWFIPNPVYLHYDVMIWMSPIKNGVTSFDRDLPCLREEIGHQEAMHMWWKVC